MSGLAPDGEEGRGLLRRELLRPEYNDENPVLRLLDWLARRLDAGLAAAGSADPLVAAAVMVVLLLGALGLAWLVARARIEAPRRRSEPGAVTGTGRSARDLRARAEAALDAGEHEVALLEAFRALAVREVEAGRLPDQPGATAREIADALADVPAPGHVDPDRRATSVRRAAMLFDGVAYGDRRVRRDEVTAVLRLDDELAGRR